MRARVVQGRVQAGRTYLVGEEFELDQKEAIALLALVPPPIEIVEEVLVPPLKGEQEPLAEPESVPKSTEVQPSPVVVEKPKRK